IILNALRKSEQERQVQQPEILENRILEKQDTVQKKNPVWLISLVIINIFLLIFFFWSFTTEDISEDVERKAVIAEKSEIKAEKTVKISPVQPVESVITKEQISIAKQLKEKKISEDKKDYEKPQQLKENTASNDKKEKPESEPQKTQRVELTKKEVTTTALVEEPLLETIPENNNSEVQQENVPPFLSELDYDFRRIVPEIDINVFVYSETKEDRFIMIDMKKYLSGQQIDAGMKLKEIRMNSIVVEYKNRVFQIQRH
ncbi:MAG: general secretion pathway protein GspB, partial [Methylococcales bacterium]|nr:general secretion pathway protein GspB [Methylococcales bacterium]